MARKVFRRGVTTTSTSVTDLGEVGDYRIEGDKKYRLVYTVATQAAKAILQIDSTDASLASYQVQSVAASSSTVFGVNDTGASIAGSTYFWALVQGPWVADSTVLGTDTDLVAEHAIGLNSDKRIGKILTVTSDHDTHIWGQAIVAVTSVASLMGNKTILIKCMGA